MWSFLLPGPLVRSELLRALAVAGFSAFFLFAAVAMGGMAFFEMARGVYGLLAAAMHSGESITAFIQGLNTAVIAMAAYDRAASWRSPLAPPPQK